MATSLLVAFIVGPSHLVIQALSTFHRSTSFCCSSFKTMARLRRSSLPLSVFLYHFHSSSFFVKQRLKERFPNLRGRLSFRTCSGTSVSPRYSPGPVRSLT